MFVLARVKDSVKVHPSFFERDQVEVLSEEVDREFSNKVILDVGLCISIFDFESIGDAYIYPLDGSAHYKVTFRLLVFRPFVGELIIGKISSQSAEGLKVTLGFTEDVFIPSYLLQAPSEFDANEQVWVWKYSEDSEDFVMDTGEEIRFRVRSLNFTQVQATAKGLLATTVSTSSGTTAEKQQSQPAGGSQHTQKASEPMRLRRRSSSVDLADPQEAPSAMQILGSINEDGLGLLSWWQ